MSKIRLELSEEEFIKLNSIAKGTKELDWLSEKLDFYINRRVGRDYYNSYKSATDPIKREEALKQYVSWKDATEKEVIISDDLIDILYSKNDDAYYLKNKVDKSLSVHLTPKDNPPGVLEIPANKTLKMQASCIYNPSNCIINVTCKETNHQIEEPINQITM